MSQHARLLRRAAELRRLESWLARDLRSGELLLDRVLRPVLRTLLGAAGLYERGRRNALVPGVKQIRFECAGLAAEFEGYRILHLSDLHSDGDARLASGAANQIRGIHADLCVLTGDYRWDAFRPHGSAYDRIAEMLDAVDAPDGVFGVLGNHDFLEDADFLARRGVRMLMNESHCIERHDASLWIAGVDDPHTYYADDLEAALEGVPAGGFKLLLAHTPELLEEAEARGIGVYLCGHTHGGQLCVPGLPRPLMLNARCPRRYAHGVWRYGRMQGYTSSGLGTSLLPVRFNCPPEIGVIELACTPGGRRYERTEGRTAVPACVDCCEGVEQPGVSSR